MRISVVIPAYNNAAALEESLGAITRSAGAEDEIIVVDDASTDGTPEAAVRFGVQLYRTEHNSGAGAARNLGARHATGDVLLFIDSDVVVEPDTIGRVKRLLEARPELTAVFGSYDDAPRAPELVSQFRNLLHHFVHQHGDPEASTFWAGCGAIRRAAFEAVNGFDSGIYTRAIEDIELGYRLRAAGYRILLDRDLRVTHLKHWTLASFLHTDVVYRALPWSRLLRQRRLPLDHLNLKTEHRVSVALAVLIALALPLAPLAPIALAFAAAACVGLMVANRKLLAFFLRARGFAFATFTVPLLFLHYLASAVGYLWARASPAAPRAAS